MRRTTVTLPDLLVERLQREADRRRMSLSHVVRETLEARFGQEGARVLPFVGLVASGDPTLADRLDEILAAEWAASVR